MRGIENFANNLRIPYESLYFVPAFSKDNNVRTVKFYGIPFSSLDRFKGKKGWYNFSVKNCEAAMQEGSSIFRV